MWQTLLRTWLTRQATQAAWETARNAALAPDESLDSANSGPKSTGDNATEAETPAAPAPCRVGLQFALTIESGGLEDLLAGAVTTRAGGRTFVEGGIAGRRVAITRSGAGAIAAREAVTALLQGHEPEWIVSAGFAGGLVPALAVGDIVLANETCALDGRSLRVDLRYDAGSSRVHLGKLLSVDRIIESPEEKRALGETHGAIAVDMETFAVAELCAERGVRFFSARVVSDAVDDRLPPDLESLMKQTTRAGKLGAAAGAILRRPGSFKEMLGLKEKALIASDRLAKFLVSLIEAL